MAKNNMKCLPADKTHRIAYYYDEAAQGVYCGHPYKGIVIAIMGKEDVIWGDCACDTLYDMYDRGIGRVVNGCVSTLDSNYFSDTNYYMNEVYKGVAYCSVDDTFNLKEGMKVARNKMLGKYYKDKRRLAAKKLKEAKKLYDKVANYIADLDRKMARAK